MEIKKELLSVHPEIVDFGSRQGRRIFSTAGVVRLRRGSKKSENAVLGLKMLFLDGHCLKSRMRTWQRKNIN